MLLNGKCINYIDIYGFLIKITAMMFKLTYTIFVFLDLRTG